MELKDRIAVIDEMNMARLSCLYGELSIDELGHVVNKHLSVCIDEIEKDLTMANITMTMKIGQVIWAR